MQQKQEVMLTQNETNVNKFIHYSNLFQIASPTDVSNFSEEFTNMEPVDSPGVDPEVSENLFAEYSYVAPSILFTENNVISEDMFRPKLQRQHPHHRRDPEDLGRAEGGAGTAAVPAALHARTAVIC